MLVTEGKKSRSDRHVALVLAAGVLGAAVALFLVWPRAIRPVLWVAGSIGAMSVLRNVALGLVAGAVPPPRAGPAVRRPSFAFVIPCLNELPSLRQTIPALRELEYEGELRFCYTVEGASTDGSADFVRARAGEDDRVVLIDKATPPGGRGAAIAYGVRHAPETDVVGLLDADHVMEQESLDELVRAFGQEDPPPGVQGMCATSNADGNAMARALTVEREWLERVELQAAPRLGGMCLFGGGQGFLLRSVLTEPGLEVDESMILDDIDLSCRLALAGDRIVFHPGVRTLSRQPETLREFFDQRYRWARGWVQLCGKLALKPFRWRRTPFGVRASLLGLLVTPFGLALTCLGVSAAMAGLTTGGAPLWLCLAVLLWPALSGICPFVAGVKPQRWRDIPLVLIGMPVLTAALCLLMAAAVTDVCILRRPIKYAKTAKPAV
jgi:cellulose synthase/poly-beta-1,6-N-acetylglucosamine synthase-like glycosyltransferase